MDYQEFDRLYELFFLEKPRLQKPREHPNNADATYATKPGSASSPEIESLQYSKEKRKVAMVVTRKNGLAKANEISKAAEGSLCNSLQENGFNDYGRSETPGPISNERTTRKNAKFYKLLFLPATSSNTTRAS